MKLSANVVVVFAHLAVGRVHFRFCSLAQSRSCRDRIALTWWLLVIRGLGNLGPIGISGVLRCWWRTAVSRDKVEDGSEFVDDTVALCEVSSFSQRDPSAWRRPSAQEG